MDRQKLRMPFCQKQIVMGACAFSLLRRMVMISRRQYSLCLKAIPSRRPLRNRCQIRRIAPVFRRTSPHVFQRLARLPYRPDARIAAPVAQPAVHPDRM